jgi:hypothetical protein
MPFGGGGGSSGGMAPAGTTTTTQTSAPWSAQAPFLQDIFGQSQNLFNNYTPQFFPQSTVAGFTQPQVQGQQAEINLGQNGTPTMNAAGGYLSNVLGGNYLNSNPFQKQEIDQISSAVTPQIESGFTQGNAMNNPAAAFATSQGLGTAVGSLLGSQFENERQMQNQAAMLAPETQNAAIQDVGLVQDAGAQQQQQNQAQLNDQIARFNFGQNLPYQKLGIYQGGVTGNFGGTSTLTQPFFENGVANGAAIGTGAGLLGQGLLNASGNQGTLSNSLPLIGAGSGGLFGGLSDRRAKNVKGPYRGALKDLQKLPISNARYKWDAPGTERPMMMAQDLQRVRPDAVRQRPQDGYLKSILPMHVVPMLIAGMRELNDKIDRKRVA